VEVHVEELDLDDEELAHVRAKAWTETESQKGILIGAKGRMIKLVGTAARESLERELGRKVHLDLVVDVRPPLAHRRASARPPGIE
jgi:GTP-binding protein Era